MSKTRTDGRPKRAPLADGNPRRLTDARCAWNKMTEAQRTEFRAFIDAPQDAYHVTLVTPNGAMAVHIDDVKEVGNAEGDRSWCWVTLSCGSTLAVLGTLDEVARRCGMPIR